jgi:regulator of protease activity HflC (stomatin/prohibitin superfamily)
MTSYANGPRPKDTITIGGKEIFYIIIGLIIFASLYGSFYTVQETERAGIRRLGHAISTEAIGPGLHFKAPFIDTADKMQVSIDNFKIENLRVYTIDNQEVKISIGITYRIPDNAVLKLLYKVGQPGNASILHNIEQIIADRTLKIFAKHNTIKISEERETISTAVRIAVSQGILEQFGMEILDLQIPTIKYSDVFVASVENAVKAKNDAIQAENTVVKIRHEGEQKVVTAKAEASAAIARAEAEKQTRILEADGEAQAIRAKGAALKENPMVIELTLAQRWQGNPPQTILGDKSATVPFFNLNHHQ